MFSLIQLATACNVVVSRSVNWLYIKHNVNNSESPVSINFLIFAFGSLFLIPSFYFDPNAYHKLTPYMLFFVVLGSFFYVIANSFRFVSLKHTDMSVVALLSQLSLVSGTVVPFVIGQNTYNHMLGLGILLVLLGNIAIVVRKDTLKNLKADIYIYMAGIAGLSHGLTSVTYGFISSSLAPIPFYLLTFPVCALMLVFTPVIQRTSVKTQLRQYSWKYIPLTVFYILAGTSIVIAVKYWGVVMASIFVSVSQVTMVLGGMVLFKERTDIVKRLLATAVVFIGAVIAVMYR